MKILIIKPSSLGDIIHALRVVQQIKVKMNCVSIDWVIKSGLEDIIRECGFVDKILTFYRGEGFVSYVQLMLQIRSCNYDYVIDMQGLLRSALMTALSRARKKIGRADGREFSTLFYKNVGFFKPNENLHAIEILAQFLKELRLDDFDSNLPLFFKTKNINKYNLNRVSVVLFPESRRKEKEWAHFKKLGEILKNELNLNVIISGVKSNENFKEFNDLRGKVPLCDLPQLIKTASLIVTNDSAPLHIASSQNAKAIALFGPTNPEKYGPFPKNQKTTTVIQSETQNINDISVEQVLNEILILIRKEI